MKNLVTTLVILLICGHSTWTNGQVSGDHMDIFPPDQKLSGWNLKDSITVYDGKNLYEHVGDLTGLYMEYGVRSSSRAIYTDKKDQKISMQAFLMINPESAWGLFSISDTNVLERNSIGDVSAFCLGSLIFAKGDWFIIISCADKGRAINRYMKEFAEYTEERIHVIGKEPVLLKSLMISENKPDDLTLFFGQEGLSSIVDFGHGTIAGFEKGAYGRYDEEQLFIISYKSDKARREWFASAQGKLNMSTYFTDFSRVEEGMTAIDKNQKPYSFRPYRQFILVVGGRDWQEASVLFDELINNLDELIP